MKESKLIEMKNKIESLTRVVQNLITEIQRNASIAGGTLSALQVHVGEDEWKKIVEELKDKEKRERENVEQSVEKGS
tara:strand:- start:332 stop:562 length:231 start_codon:yes stop_codon:yes gene_type:complete